MTATMFADLVNYLIQPFERRVIVTRTNLVEEVLNICKLFNYKGKAEKSWLITGNHNIYFVCCYSFRKP